ncbi:MAG: hypothetical protein U0230_02040 [Polyangiales bacterium]
MSPRPPVRIPSAREDAPALARAAVAGLLAFVVGVALARASLDRDLVREADRGATPTAGGPRSETASDGGASGAASPDAAGAPSTEATTDAGTAEAEPTEPTPSEDAAEAAAEEPAASDEATAPPALEPAPAASAPAVAPTASSDATVVHGRIAYIRCDGVPPVAGPVPCPRDLSMERAVWAAIDRLPARCAALGGARGAADVRVVFDGARVSGLGFRDAPSPALPAEPVRACLEPALGTVTQSLGATRLTASFRFELR